ncbi:uncharacterized protein LOC122010570 [Zingiber officinale]|uniref:uncharacterized protein LOC122010570 n=1 Tax=Zingiber officinale TaxID=94328 RepID=UPI001C4BF143|nr:uncharacterized protein LOC122010570 [Zingiber officinale]
MDLDFAFRHDHPAPLIDDSTVDQKVTFDKWEKSNCISLMIMRMSIPESLRGSITEKEDAKTFLKELADQFVSNENVETTILLMKLVSMQYIGKGNIREYIMEMSNLEIRGGFSSPESSSACSLKSSPVASSSSSSYAFRQDQIWRRIWELSPEYETL